MGTQTKHRVVRMKISCSISSRVFGHWPKACVILFLLVFVFSHLAFAQSDWAKRAEKLSSELAGSTESKREALYQIRNIRTPEASRLVLPALGDIEPIVRATAAGSVVFLPPTEASKALLPLLSDKDAFVRTEAAYALGTVGDPFSAVPLVQTLTTDKVLEVRDASAVALGRIGDASSVPFLVAILERKPSEKDEFLRRSAARSIGQIAQFYKTGKSKVVTPQNFLPERFKQTESGAVKETDLKLFESAVSVLIKVLEHPKEAEDTRREAAFALGAIGNPASVNALKSASNCPDPYLAEICKEALLKLQ